MKAILSIIFLWISLLVFGQNRFDFVQDKPSAVIPFRFVNDLIVVKTKINDVLLNMIFDTGVKQTVLINLINKDSLGLRQQKQRYFSGVGNKNTKIGGIVSNNNILKIGDAMINRHATIYLIADFKFHFSETMGVKINGFIGGEWIKDYIVKVDYKEKKLIFYKHKTFDNRKLRRYEAFDVDIVKDKPYIHMDVYWNSRKEKPVRAKFLIDLGNNDAFWFFQNDSLQIPKGKKTINDYFGFGFSGEISGKRTKVRKVSLGKKKHFTNVYTALPDTIFFRHITDSYPFDGLVGNSVLKRFYIYLDYQNKKVYFRKYWRNYRQQFLFNDSGIFLTYDGKIPLKVKTTINHFSGSEKPLSGHINIEEEFIYRFEMFDRIIVHHIRKDSPADRSGLAEGDIILEINGQDVYQYQLYELDEKFFYHRNKYLKFLVERNGVRHEIKVYNTKQL